MGAIFQGIEGQWEAMYCHYKDLHQALKSKKPGESREARVLWAMKDARDRGE